MARHTEGEIFSRDGWWYLRCQHNGRSIKRALGTRDRADAERAKEPMLQRIIDPQFGLPLAEAFDSFVNSPARPQCGPGQLANYVTTWQHFRLWLEKVFPEIKTLGDIMPAIGENYFATQEMAILSPGTYNQTLGRLRVIMRVLMPRVAPGEGVFDTIQNKRRPRGGPSTGRRELSEAELRAVCAAADAEYRPLFAIGLYTGMRLGDCATLRWEELTDDLSHVARRTLKTGRMVRIPVHRELRAILEETPKENRKDWVLPGIAVDYAVDRRRVSERIQKVFEKAGITQTSQKHAGMNRATCAVGFHSLRHSFVTICAKAGVPLSVVQELAGHGSPAIQRAYLHMGSEAGRAIAALPSLIEAPCPPALPSGACCHNWTLWSMSHDCGYLQDMERAIEPVKFCPWCGARKE